MDAFLKSLGTDVQEFIDLRRDLHRHPELSFAEHRTSDIVASRLARLGYTVEQGMGGTGVVGQLRRGNGLRQLGIRADMDALPIEEKNSYSWVSQSKGVMHACGHDGHTAMLLAAAQALAHDSSWTGVLTLIFQPAEEQGGPRSGAVRMIEDGLFDKYPVDAIYSMHNAPGVPQGRLQFREGSAMASSDRATIRLVGVGGHAAKPEQTIDPTVAAASLVMALQTVVSRNVGPSQSAVISVGMLQAGGTKADGAYNVIPQDAVLGLSIRALDPAVRSLLEERIREIAHGQANSYGCMAEVEYFRGYAPVVNTRRETEFAKAVGLELLGSERVDLERPAAMGSEDFAFMLERKPGCYLFIGNGSAGVQGGCPVHNPNYDFNDDNVAIGGAYWHLLAKRYLSSL